MSDTPSADAKPKKKGKLGKILVFGLGFLVLVGGGAGAGLYAAKSGLVGGAAKPAAAGPQLVPKSKQKHPTEAAGSSEAPAAPTGGMPTPAGQGGDQFASNYYAMDKDFTANLQNSVHFVQVGVAVSTPYDDKVIDNLKTNEIAVRSAILMTLGDATEDQVFSSDGKRQLQGRLVQAINGVLQQKEGFGGISNVYFTNFVVQ